MGNPTLPTLLWSFKREKSRKDNPIPQERMYFNRYMTRITTSVEIQHDGAHHPDFWFKKF